jgi:hypothetical protein
VGGGQPSLGVLGEDRRVIRRLAAGVLLLGLVACSEGSEDSTADPPPSPTSRSTTATPAPPVAATPPPAPRVDSCHRLSYAAAVAPSATSGTTDCSGPHTSETFFVGRLDTVVGGRLLAVDSDRVRRQVAAACPRRLGKLVGGSEEQLRLSMVRSVWFTPTVKASDAGASWFRCDAVVLSGSRSLLRLDGSLQGVLGTEAGQRRYGICGTAEPGTPGFTRVVCERAHSWRAIRTVSLDDGDYPGEQQVRTAGEEPCRAAGRSAASDPLDFQWGYEWPSADQWEGGRTYGVCWVPD